MSNLFLPWGLYKDYEIDFFRSKGQQVTIFMFFVGAFGIWFKYTLFNYFWKMAMAYIRILTQAD